MSKKPQRYITEAMQLRWGDNLRKLAEWARGQVKPPKRSKIMKYWVIEHPTRGWYVGHDYNDNMDWVPKFRWSIPASHSDVVPFWSAESADARLATVQEHRYGKAARLKMLQHTG